MKVAVVLCAALAFSGAASFVVLRRPVSAVASSGKQTPVPVVQTAPTPSPTPRAVVFAGANELGRIPVLMYHSVGERGARDRHGLNISADTFRKHLQLLRQNNFYPVNMRDLLSPTLSVPAGKTPVVLTFDDARPSQFRYKADGVTVDPTCAMGILEAFHAKHPSDWPRRASFYVLPESKYNPTPFGQAKTLQKKLQYLVDSGYELANHSTSHHALSKMDAKRLAWESTTCRDYFQSRVKGATMDTFACPYGIYPRSDALLNTLAEQGNRCVLMAWGDASFAPMDKRFDRLHVMRVGSTPGNIENWIRALANARKKPDSSLYPYVSDGDPNVVTVPANREKFVVRDRLAGVRLAVLPAPAKPKSAAKPVKPIVAKR